jgi:hypothetical protein
MIILESETGLRKCRPAITAPKDLSNVRLYGPARKMLLTKNKWQRLQPRGHSESAYLRQRIKLCIILNLFEISCNVFYTKNGKENLQ